MTRRRLAIVLAVLVLVPVIRIASTWTLFSQTIDEPIHVAAGFQWLDEGRYTLDREHPPLARIFFAIDAWLDGAEIDRSLSRAARGNQLLERNEEYPRNLTAARAGNLPFFLLALAIVFLWTRRLAGDLAGVIAAALFGALPPVLAHAGLTTTDMAAAAGTAAALFTFALWLEQPNWKHTLLFGLALGAGLLGKFSFLIFFGAGFLVLLGVRASLFLLRRGHTFVLSSPAEKQSSDPIGAKERSSDPDIKERRCDPFVVRFLAAGIVAILLIWLAYRGETGLLNSVRLDTFDGEAPQHIAARYAREPGYEWVRPDLLDRYYDFAGEVERKHGIAGIDFVDWAKAAGYPSPLAGRKGNTLAGAPPVPKPTLSQRVAEPFRASLQWIATHIPILAPSYIAGAEYVRRHSAVGHPAYLFGESRNTGWWYYFPVILFYKTPLAFLALAMVGGLLLGARPRPGITGNQQPATRTAKKLQTGSTPENLALALIPLAMLAVAMTSRINIGVRHILPLYPFLALAAAVAVVWLWHRGKAARVTVAALLVWFFAGTTLAHPDYLAWFNEVAGRHPERVAADSNLDWGQDLLRLAAVAETENLSPLYVDYWGSTGWKQRLPHAEKIPARCVTGWIAISEMSWIEKHHGSLAWLKNHSSRRRVGKSIRLYFVPSCDTDQK